MSPVHCMQFFLFSVCVHLFTLFSYFVYYSDRLHYQINLEKEYDYVIVGSGTAGSLIAHRLATETNHSFIVLEAGSRSHALLAVPVLGPFLHRSVFDWQFESEPQIDACRAMQGNKCRLPQGKIVGGSSQLNNMVHVRGNISHYVNWFHGEYSKKHIESQLEFIENNIISVDDIQYQSKLANAILEGAIELGYKNISEEFEQGFKKSKVSQKNGKRWATTDNLLTKHIISNAHIESIMFTGNTATGVNVNLFETKYGIQAKKGVILSAGAINTPKILQLSGIGPENILKSLDIPIVKVLPVGKNLQDHVATGLDLVLFNNSVSIDAFDMINPLNAFRYFWNGKGPMTTPGCEAIGFVSTKNDNAPDIQFMLLPVGLASDRGSLFSKNLGVRDEIWEKYFAKNVDKHVATLLPLVLHPKSKGEVYITSRDPKKAPLYDPRYLSNQEDVITLTKGLKIMVQLLETDAMKSLGAYLNTDAFPGCADKEFFSDSYLECYIRHLTMTSYHPVGTCPMGLPGAKNSVVDINFRVIGVNRLYIADASVLPALPSGNINAAVAMMASVFFDANIGSESETIVPNNEATCFKNEIFESIFNMCYVRNISNGL